MVAARSVKHARRIASGVSAVGLVVILLVTALLTPAVASADSGSSWRGEYYNNVSLAGAPMLVRDDSAVNFDWAYGSPDTAVYADRFSARWTSYTYFSGGNYTFHATTDDGVRVWIDESLLIDQWHDHPETTYTAGRYLGTGYHSLRVEYYDNSGPAVCKFWWDGSSGTTISDWRGEYYNNTWMGGGAAVVRNDASVNFDWGYGSPASGVAADNFSARWTKTAYFNEGTHTFYATVDDGVRVYVDNALVINQWYAQSRTSHSGSIYLGAGNHEVRVEYFEGTGAAVCMVNWSGGGAPSPGQPYYPPTGQEIIVDNRDANFKWGGPAGSFYSRSTGYRGHLYWTWNSRTQLSNWGKWFPYVSTPGYYDVSVYIPNRYHGSKSATYRIYHNGTRDDRIVVQNNYNNQWVGLGTYYFRGGSDEYVFLGDNTGETYATRYIGFDAVRFVATGSGQPQPGPGVPSGCAITPILGFGRIWNGYSGVRSGLGCATETEKGIWAAEQSFQGGYMFWRNDTNSIYTIYNNGTWASFPDTWTSAEPDRDPSIVPPPGYFQPTRGFGKLWRNNGSIQNAMGWGLSEERGFQGSIQSFQNGTMLWSSTRGFYVLYSNGRWERYD